VAMCSASTTFSDVPDSKKGGATLPAKRAGSPLVPYVCDPGLGG